MPADDLNGPTKLFLNGNVTPEIVVGSAISDDPVARGVAENVGREHEFPRLQGGFPIARHEGSGWIIYDGHEMLHDGGNLVQDWREYLGFRVREVADEVFREADVHPAPEGLLNAGAGRAAPMPT